MKTDSPNPTTEEPGVNRKPVKISCQNLTMTFIQKGSQRVPVLREVSMEVYDQEFLVVLGPGQCGKTTLLRIIAGLETPTEGQIFLDGQRITGPGPGRGLVFQSYMLLPWKTVLANVELAMELSGHPPKQRRDVARRHLELVGLKDFADYYPHQLSGGMKQRVGIARAFATNPKVLLMDEPFGQLDAQTRLFMEKETERIWLGDKRTMIFVTNNIDEALLLADRIVVMDGKLPGTVRGGYVVDFPRPRDNISLEFLQLRQTITDAQELIL